ncbi:MAG TPA: LamG-like jellyroll fold domain-containing protein [Pyrinomonadaceae bacterium]|nr:LamG-like jellyroll fold domain-containing protein [Pyrinomonadaceae bacterium]
MTHSTSPFSPNTPARRFFRRNATLIPGRRWLSLTSKLFLLLACVSILGMIFLKSPGTQAQSSSNTVRFAVIGDYGSAGQPLQDVANLIKSWNPEFIITLGDNNYPDGAAATMDQNVGQYFHEFIGNYKGSYGPGSAVNRFFPSLGDHDWGNVPTACPECVQPYMDYFTLPGNERNYDFTWGPVHLFAIDSDPANSTLGVQADQPQALWLRDRLAASTARWKIVYMHHPPYTSGDEPTNTAMRWPYKEWGADIVLGGHEHLYERLLVDGFPYIVNGLGGHSHISEFLHPLPETKVRYSADFGAMLVEADTEVITFKFITRAGVLIDTYTIPEPTASMHCKAPPLSAGMVARWPAEGHADDPVGGNNGVLLDGTTTFVQGQVGQAFNFAGETSAIEVNSQALQSAFTTLTIGAWVNPSSHGRTSGFDGAFGRTILSNTEGDGLSLRIRDGYVQADFRLTSGDVLHTFPQAQLPLNQWSHVALTYDGFLITAYLNGQLLGSTPATGVVRNALNAHGCTFIGNEPALDPDRIQNGDFGWRGSIDEVEFFSRALAPVEIQGIYNAGVTGKCYEFASVTPTGPPSALNCVPSPPGIIAWVPGNGNAHEIVSGFNGVARNGTAYAPGQVDRAFSFIGTTSTVSLPSAALHDAFSALTIDAWVLPLSYGADTSFGGIFGRTIVSNTDAGDGFALRVLNGSIQADLRLSGGDVLHAFNQEKVPFNVWSHVALTYDGAQVKAYLNGQLVGSTPASGTVRNAANANICTMIGNDPNLSTCDIQPSGFGWHGGIDEVSIFNRALDAAEIIALYQAGSAGKCNELVPPTTAAGTSPIPNPSSGSNGDVTVTLTATDNPGGSGVKEITYSASGAQVISQTTVSGSSTSFIISAEGTTTITYFAMDNMGNVESQKVFTVKIDKTAPIISCPADQTAFATSSAGAIVSYPAPTATDNNPGVTLQSSPASGSVFPVGTTTVNSVATDAVGNTAACSFNVTVSQAQLTSAVTVTPGTSQYSDRVTFEATLSPYLGGPLPATSATFKVGSQTMGTASLVVVGSALKATLSNVQLMMAPGTYTVMAQFGGIAPGLTISDATTALNHTAENALITYSGLNFISTSSTSTSTATVTLRATVQDITATSIAAGDTSFGDIRNAKVSFVITNALTEAAVATISNLSVTLINSTDTKTGTVAYNWTANIGSANSVTYRVHMIVSNYYTRDSTADDELVTVSKPMTSFVTGGGHLLLSSPAGLLAGDVGSKLNFGFSIKSTSTKKGTTLTGMGGMIVRRGGRVYKFVGSALTSLVANASTGAATFKGKIIIVDITNPKAPVTVDSNASFEVVLTDKGEPGSSDTIAVSVWKATNELYFSSRWDGAKTVQQLLGAGNLRVK